MRQALQRTAKKRKLARWWNKSNIIDNIIYVVVSSPNNAFRLSA